MIFINFAFFFKNLINLFLDLLIKISLHLLKTPLLQINLSNKLPSLLNLLYQKKSQHIIYILSVFRHILNNEVQELYIHRKKIKSNRLLEFVFISMANLTRLNFQKVDIIFYHLSSFLNLRIILLIIKIKIIKSI